MSLINDTLFHASIEKGIKSFFPFSHFGTLRSAQERLLTKHGRTMPKQDAVIYPVQLNIVKPLLIDDIGSILEIFYPHGIRKYSILTQQEVNHCFEFNWRAKDFDFNTELPKSVYEEIKNAGLYNFYLSHHSDDCPVTQQVNLRDSICRQRLLFMLEQYGFDGIKYINEHEDKGSISWAPFRPEQIRPTGPAFPVTKNFEFNLVQ